MASALFFDVRLRFRQIEASLTRNWTSHRSDSFPEWDSKNFFLSQGKVLILSALFIHSHFFCIRSLSIIISFFCYFGTFHLGRRWSWGSTFGFHEFSYQNKTAILEKFSWSCRFIRPKSELTILQIFYAPFKFEVENLTNILAALKAVVCKYLLLYFDGLNEPEAFLLKYKASCPNF